ELRPLPFDDAEEARVVEVARHDQLVEAIGTARRPIAMHRNEDRAFGGIEADAVVAPRGARARLGAAHHTRNQSERDQTRRNPAHVPGILPLAAIALAVERPLRLVNLLPPTLLL